MSTLSVVTAVLLAFAAFGVHNLQPWLERWEHEWHLDGGK